MGYMIRLLAVLCCALAGFQMAPASAEKRVALVIGNSAYQHTRPLPNPKNDAEAIAKLLRENGFADVTLKIDLDYRAMREALRQFGGISREADIAVVYYAGHGLELAGENYLVPIDAKLARDLDLDYEAVTLASILNVVGAARKLKLVILDACRNNPLGDRIALRAGATRSVARGLARIEPKGEVLVAYSAKAGTLAHDGVGRHSPYSEALLKHMTTPGLDVIRMFGRVKESVLKATQDAQEPWIYGSPSGEAITLVPALVVPPKSAGDAEAAHKALEAERERLAEERRLLDEERKKLVLKAPPVSAIEPEKQSKDEIRPAADGEKHHADSAAWAGWRLIPQIAPRNVPEAVAVSPDGRWIVSGGTASIAEMRDAKTGLLIRRLEDDEGAHAFAFSPDGRWIAGSQSDHTVKLWEAETGRLVRTLRMPKPAITRKYVEHYTVWAVRFSADGRWIVAGGKRTIGLWEAATGRLIRTIETQGPVDIGGAVYSVAIFPDGRWIVSGGDAGTQLWERETGRLVRALGFSSPTSLAVAPDGRWIVVGGVGHSKNLEVWDAAKGRLVRRLEGHTHWVDALAVSQDGLWIVSGSRDYTVKVWEATSGRPIRTIETGGSVDEVAISPDGLWIVSTGLGGLHVWETATGRLARTIAAPAPKSKGNRWTDTPAVESAALSPDRRWIVSGHWGGTVRVWEAATGRLTRTIETHPKQYENVVVVVSPDGRSIISSEYVYGTIHGTHPAKRWNLATGQEQPVEDGDKELIAARSAPVNVTMLGSTIELKSEGGAQQATFTSLPGGHWVSILADGLTYTGSPGIEAHLMLVKGDELRPVDDAFRRQFFKPDGLGLTVP